MSNPEQGREDLQYILKAALRPGSDATVSGEPAAPPLTKVDGRNV
jgi:hypothetical protein